VTLAETFPLASEIATMTSYSGLVAPTFPATPGDGGIADVVVSAGGGAVGRHLIEAAVEAKSLSSLAAARWLMVTGLNASASEYEALTERAQQSEIAVVRFVSDLPRVLTGARLSISQSGYNTVADILVARCRAVFVPFAAGGETEQTRRAELLERRGLGVAVSEAELDPARLAAAIDRAVALPLATLELDIGGAVNTAAILRRLLSQKA
jgi:predicted glycosyltransferase